MSNSQAARVRGRIVGRFGGLAVAGAILLAAPGCAPSTPPPNVLLITLDTTRADRLGCYGYDRAETPTLDALAEGGVRFANAHAQVPLTLPSHTGMLTGTYSRSNGIQVNGGARVDYRIPVLAERLRDDGYRTAAFVSSFVLDATFGLDRGFDLYDDRMGNADPSVRFQSERPANGVVDAALGWLDTKSDRPFFAWVHFYDPHSPFAPPKEYRARFDEPYDGEIAFVDDQLRRLIDWLDRRNLRENTLIVVAGDHGESFDEHDEPDHGLYVYDTTILVPLLVSWPAYVSAGHVASETVQLIDLYPTILELSGAEQEAGIQGVSLAPMLRGESDTTRSAYGESRYGQVGYGWAPLRYLARGRFKYIEAPDPELYDRQNDPGELENLIERNPDVALDLREALLKLERQWVPLTAEAIDLDTEARQKLQSLGYIGGASSTAVDLYRNNDDLRDPKTMIEVFREHSRAGSLIKRGRHAEAAALLETLASLSPESIDFYENLGWAYLSLGRNRDAQRAYEKSLTNLPEHSERLWGLGEALRRQNKLDDAIRVYELALRKRPMFGEAHMGLTLAYSAGGRWEQALEHARRHVEINPASLLALGNLLNVAKSLRRFDDAHTAIDGMLALDPNNRDAHNARWQALFAAGRRDEAVSSLRDSLTALPDDWSLTCSLAWMLAVSAGQDSAAAKEAVRLATAAVQAKPEHPRSLDTLAVAYAATGSFDKAVEAARRALQRAGGSDKLRQAIEARLALFEEGRPLRE